MLRFIFGRSGYGKTEYCFKRIEKLIENGEKNILLITPEQYNFTAERRLLTALGESGINLVENSSFSRLYNEVTRLHGGSSLPVLSKGGKAVMFKKAIDAVSDDLQVFNKKTDSSSFVSSMVRIYDEMKSCDISYLDMENTAKSVEKEILSLKLQDMSKIISSYENMIKGSYLDSADELSRLYEKLCETDYLDGRTVFIDGFNGFVASEYKIIKLIIKRAKCVYITLATDSYDKNEKYNLFSYVNSVVKIISDIAKKNNVPKEIINLTKNCRTDDENLLFAEKNLYSRCLDSRDDIPNSIRIYSAKSISDECNYASIQIKKHLRNGVKAKDIAVICRDADKYSNELAYSFRKYEIPFFDDERQPINMQPLVVFVQYLLRSVIYSYRSDDILSLAKTGLTSLASNKISMLENYIYLWNISGVKKWNNEFVSSTKGFVSEISESDKRKIDDLNISRKYLISKIERFKFASKDATAAEIGEAVYNALIDFNVNKHLKDIASSLSAMGKNVLAEEQGRIWDLLMQILNQLAIIGGDERISLKEYFTYFNIMISAEDLGVLPQGLDNVQFGQADRMRADNPKVVFVLGANEGEFPRAITSGGLLSESDRVILSKNQFELYSFGETLNFQERYFAYMATSVASENLYVSYIGNGEGSPSVIVSSLKELFPSITELTYNDIPKLDLVESKASAFELMAEYFNSNTEFSESLKKYFRNDDRYNSVALLADNIDVKIENEALSTSLFGRDMYLSASRLEDFFNCRFRYFCKFGLMAKPRERAEMNAMKTGVVIHYVLEKIISEIGSKNLGAMSRGELHLAVNKYLLQYFDNELGSTDELTKRFKYQFMRLSKMLNSVVERLADEFSQSKFEARAFELEIDSDKEVKPKVISLKDGGSISIRGAIDRVDTYTENGIQYVRVVDYKSGTKKFKLSDILYGLNLQMFVYLFTLCNDKNSKYHGIPAGVLYMHASKAVHSISREDVDKSLASDNNKEFKMNGLVLYDEEHDILDSMEKDIAGKYIPVKISSRNELSGSFASLEELGKISQKIELLIAEMGISLHKGEINQNPINGQNHDKTCEFCDYSSVCANRRIIETCDMEKISDNDVLEILKGGVSLDKMD